MLALLGEHDEADTDESQNRHPGIGLEPLGPGQGVSAAFDAVQSGEPGGDGGTDIGTHDDTHGLPQQHGAGIDEAHDHDGGGGGGLNDGGYDKSQKQSLEAVGGQIPQNGLELATRALFQRVAHDIHTVEEQRQTAYQCQYVKDSHVISFLSVSDCNALNCASIMVSYNCYRDSNNFVNNYLKFGVTGL